MTTDAQTESIPAIALGYIQNGYQTALATVLETWGSAPRPVGAQLAIRSDGVFMGSVSGGCVEGAVVAEALDALETGECQILEYGVSDEEVFAVGLACGGTIRILVEPIGVGQGPSVDLIESLVERMADKHPVGLQVNLETWDRTLVSPETMPNRFRTDKSGTDENLFTTIHNPPLRMIIIGAVHIAQSLVQLATIAGYDVHLVDPRDSFGAAERFRGIDVVNDWPDTALSAIGVHERTAVVTLSHDPKIDTPALEVALKSAAFYVGSLGSKRTHGKRVAALTDAGFGPEEIERIHGPVGLDIGASTPAEIAVSIMAEVTQTLRKSGIA